MRRLVATIAVAGLGLFALTGCDAVDATIEETRDYGYTPQECREMAPEAPNCGLTPEQIVNKLDGERLAEIGRERDSAAPSVDLTGIAERNGYTK